MIRRIIRMKHESNGVIYLLVIKFFEENGIYNGSGITSSIVNDLYPNFRDYIAQVEQTFKPEEEQQVKKQSPPKFKTPKQTPKKRLVIVEEESEDKNEEDSDDSIYGTGLNKHLKIDPKNLAKKCLKYSIYRSLQSLRN